MTISTYFDSTTAVVDSFDFSPKAALVSAVEKVKDILASPLGQGLIGFGLGFQLYRIYGPLTCKTLTLLQTPIPSQGDPFKSSNSLIVNIFLTPFLCAVCPIIEEIVFRGDLQEALKNRLTTFFTHLGFSGVSLNIASRMTSVFFTSIIFGLVHFTNAIIFWCHPSVLLPQVISATMIGLMFSLAKECSGGLQMPIGLHIGNNTRVWASRLGMLG